MRWMIDVNVLLDLALQRPPWVVEAIAIFDASRAGRVELYVTAASMPTFFYVASKSNGRASAFGALDRVLMHTVVLPTDSAMIYHARALPGRDFEDNVQIACAMAAEIDLIVTRDPKGFAHSPIRAVDPAEAARLLPADL